MPWITTAMRMKDLLLLPLTTPHLVSHALLVGLSNLRTAELGNLPLHHHLLGMLSRAVDLVRY